MGFFIVYGCAKMQVFTQPNFDAVQSSIMDHIKTTKLHYFETKPDGPIDYKFCWTALPFVARQHIENQIRAMGFTDIEGLRVNVFTGDHYIEKHVDTVFSGYETLIMPILNEGQTDRLRIWPTPTDEGSFRFNEQLGYGLILVEGTPHAIERGLVSKCRRISVCGWVK